MNRSIRWPAIHEVDLLATIVEAKQDEANLLCAPFTLADERILRDFGHISLGRYLNFMSRPVMKARNGEESEKRKMETMVADARSGNLSDAAAQES